MKFTRHLIECHCILKIYQNNTKPIYHKFPVFSLLDEKENLSESKYVACNNCGSIHEVVDICKSDVKWGSDVYDGLVVTKEDVKFNLINKGLSNITDILEINDCDVSIWELVEYCIENKIDYSIVLSKQDIQDNTVYNCLNIVDGNIKIKKEISQRFI